MAGISAGLLMYRLCQGAPEVFLVHPGGPYFKNKNEGYWTIPKGEPEKDEEYEAAAKREFFEETGIVPVEPLISLGAAKQKGGKWVHCWTFECNDSNIRFVSSVNFELEWPPRSGKKAAFPEVDKGEFFIIQEAKKKINPAQAVFLDRLLQYLDKN
ncbi:MAG: NUDIX domain-containing protein [Cytophagaceae bacterium]